MYPRSSYVLFLRNTVCRYRFIEKCMRNKMYYYDPAGRPPRSLTPGRPPEEVKLSVGTPQVGEIVPRAPQQEPQATLLHGSEL